MEVNAELAWAMAVLAIVGLNVLSDRLRIASPLLLVALGVLLSFIPATPDVEVDPEVLLEGVLPLLLYSAAVSLPAVEFRRDFTAIGGLSVILVAFTATVLGLFFSWAIPGLGLAAGIALGAVISPTDAVATSIVKRLGVPPRVVTVLEGESLLNDASALVLLRSAIAATAGAVSLWGIAGDFVWAVFIAVVCGLIVGMANLRARRAVRSATASTALSIVAPFLAAVPAEHLGGSGLVAAVTAGLVTGLGAPHFLRAEDRMYEATTWATIGMLLEGLIFLLMGLQLNQLVGDVREEHGSVQQALLLGMVAVSMALVVRAGYFALLLRSINRRTPEPEEVRARIKDEKERGKRRMAKAPPGWEDTPRAKLASKGWARRVRRLLADVEYYRRWRLGPREGVVLVWAGMRGAVTVAAAQTLPADQPNRSLLVLIAFSAAGLSLLVQGGTLAWVVRRLGLQIEPGEDDMEERIALLDRLAQAALGLLDDPTLRRADGAPFDKGVVQRSRKATEHSTAEAEEDGSARLRAEAFELRLRIVAVQREELHRARDSGQFSSAVLGDALNILDADQVSTQLKRRSYDAS